MRNHECNQQSVLEQRVAHWCQQNWLRWSQVVSFSFYKGMKKRVLLDYDDKESVIYT